MKKLFTLFLIFIATTSVFAGQGGPDLWGYTWKDSNEPGGPAYNWIDIVNEGGIEVKLLQDDNIRGPFQMNFDFTYYWYNVNQFYVGSNGYICFQFGNLASPFPFSPSTAAPNDLIGAFMNDLTFAGSNDSAECYYRINAAKDTLIVSYVNVPYFDINANGQSGNNTFQIILSKVDSSITFQYKVVTPVSPFSGGSAVGIENYAGSLGLFYNSSTFLSPPQNYAIKYYYPHNPTLQVKDVFMVNNDNPETGAIFLPANSGSPHTLSATVKNGGNVPSIPFNVQGIVKDPSGNQIVSELYYVDTLEAQEAQSFDFAQQVSPISVGTYKYITITQMPGDNIPSNNSKNQEVVVIDTSLAEITLSYNGNQNYEFSLNWVGDEGGAGTYFIPPFYPITVTKLHYFVTGNGLSVNMSARIFDDDGINGLPFTMYDSVYIYSSDIAVNAWTDVELPDPVTITSGGFYVSWDMQGESISLGCTGTPVSNRSFEVFENGWGVSRYRDLYDPMITATFTAGFPTGYSDLMKNDLALQVFPNPASDVATINFSSSSNENVWLVISDLQGRMINRWNLGKGSNAEQHFNADVSNYAAGMYLVQLYSGKNKKMEKLVIGE